jgi:hypothetical protein
LPKKSAARPRVKPAAEAIKDKLSSNRIPSFLTRNRKFESISLQGRVWCEPDFPHLTVDAAVLRSAWAGLALSERQHLIPGPPQLSGAGPRHFAWDAGYGFEIRDAYRSGYAVLAATAVLTVLGWLYVLLA